MNTRNSALSLGLVLAMAADIQIGNGGKLSAEAAAKVAESAAQASKNAKQALLDAQALAKKAKMDARLAANPDLVIKSVTPKEATILESARGIIVLSVFNGKTSEEAAVNQLKGLLVVAEVIKAGKAPVLTAAIAPIVDQINANIAKISGTPVAAEVAATDEDQE